jgi:hypothetical protein
MIVEDKRTSIELEISVETVEELTTRSESMGLTASEYIVCVIGQHVAAE